MGDFLQPIPENILRGKKKPKRRQSICITCEYIAVPNVTMGGSVVIELVLWLIGGALFIILNPAFILLPLAYTSWRLTTKVLVCPLCGRADMIPVDSPRGNRMIGNEEDEPDKIGELVEEIKKDRYDRTIDRLSTGGR